MEKNDVLTVIGISFGIISSIIGLILFVEDKKEKEKNYD